MSEPDWIMIAIAIATPVILIVTLSRVVSLVSAGPGAGGGTLSLSYAALFDFALAEADRSEVLKTYFAWKHDVLLEMLKAVAAFALANVALAVRFLVDPDPAAAAQIEELIGLHVGPTILSGLAAIAFIALWLMSRLRRIPAEYSVCVRFLDRVR